jgi:hypothetical protein
MRSTPDSTHSVGPQHCLGKHYRCIAVLLLLLLLLMLLLG